MAWLVEHGRIVLHLSVADWFDQVEKSGVAMPSTACKPWPSSRAIVFEGKWDGAAVVLRGCIKVRQVAGQRVQTATKKMLALLRRKKCGCLMRALAVGYCYTSA